MGTSLEKVWLPGWFAQQIGSEAGAKKAVFQAKIFLLIRGFNCMVLV
jgi:hypothetical protein